MYVNSQKGRWVTEEIMAKIFPNLVKTINHGPGAQRISSKIKHIFVPQTDVYQISENK